MSKQEAIHELYISCKEINVDETQNLVTAAQTEEEADFINLVTDFMIQQRQKRAIAKKRF